MRQHRINVRYMDSGSRLPRFESQFCDTGLVTGYLTFDSQILHQVGIIMVPNS